jgi:hypothetical protein
MSSGVNHNDSAVSSVSVLVEGSGKIRKSARVCVSLLHLLHLTLETATEANKRLMR